MNFCKICGAACRTREYIEARKGTYYLVCTYCFEKYRGKTMKEIRGLIKQ